MGTWMCGPTPRPCRPRWQWPCCTHTGTHGNSSCAPTWPGRSPDWGPGCWCSRGLGALQAGRRSAWAPGTRHTLQQCRIWGCAGAPPTTACQHSRLRWSSWWATTAWQTPSQAPWSALPVACRRASPQGQQGLPWGTSAACSRSSQPLTASSSQRPGSRPYRGSNRSREGNHSLSSRRRRRPEQRQGSAGAGAAATAAGRAHPHRRPLSGGRLSSDSSKPTVWTPAQRGLTKRARRLPPVPLAAQGRSIGRPPEGSQGTLPPRERGGARAHSIRVAATCLCHRSSYSAQHGRCKRHWPLGATSG